MSVNMIFWPVETIAVCLDCFRLADKSEVSGDEGVCRYLSTQQSRLLPVFPATPSESEAAWSVPGQASLSRLRCPAIRPGPRTIIDLG